MCLAAAACAAFVALGNWQSRRADEKRAAGAAVERAAARGVFDARFVVLLDNKLLRGRSGYHVVQPLRLAGDGTSRHVLVNRGWIAAGSARDLLPAVRTPAAEVSIEGVRLPRFPQAFDPGDVPPRSRPGTPVIWQNVTVEAFRAWSGLALEPTVIEQHSMLDDGLVREWAKPGSGAEVHDSYALQWYSFAVATVVLLVALGWRRHGPAA